MTNRLVFIVSAIALMALAAPSAAQAQAQRRGGSSSSSSSGSSGGGAVAAPRQPTAAPRPAVREPSSASSGVSRPAGRAATTSGERVTPARGASSADQRVRSSRAAIGTAQPRSAVPRSGRPGGFDPWYRWSPGYTFGYGVGYGYGYPYSYGVFSPWGYRSGLWGWGYDPFLIDPFAYGYGYGYGGAPYWGGGAGVDDRGAELPTGSIRFRVKPDDARVYIDGALAGVAGEFGGLTGHLELSPGIHDIELRADGYRPYTGQLEVREGRTRTERVNLERE